MPPTNSCKTLTLGSWVFLAPVPATQRYLLLMLPTLLLCLLVAMVLSHNGFEWVKTLNVLSGQGSQFEHFILLQLRLPRALVALGAGAALAISGAIFQTTTRNALGSPDIIGITAGASAGVVATLLLWPGVIPVPVGAFLGACCAVALVYAGSINNLSHSGKIVISGIAVGALCMAFVNFAISQVRLEQANQMAALLSGSLAEKNWCDVWIIGLTLSVVTPGLVYLSRQLNFLSLGSGVAQSLGVNVGLTHLLSLLLAIALATAAVLVVGPVAFIALSAPQITRHLLRSKGITLLCTALMGALLLLASDIITLLLPTPSRLPVGVITAAVGGIYLMYLLYAEVRRIK
ncbi:putative iron-siderophore transport system%2C membrane permease [Yersinia aldovae]|uniref:Putative iron-siderophore transport system, membrane permease n=1 Tax=Yersinia aldovae TaxID=29483 RepID=A0A0T9UPM8_YERAL|nr:iron chelate uptake ABC transporter family permease subunit [Yersinia aldovae]CNL58830.1 putative iron-siderophore transport system%2C membrane permease [Yersinia aldovae]